MKSIIIFISFLALAYARTTSSHHGHHGHAHTTTEPDEKGSIMFAYDHTHHLMNALWGHRCFLYRLSSDERTAVHTGTGLRHIELKVIHMIENLSGHKTTVGMATGAPMTTADMTQAPMITPDPAMMLRAVTHNFHAGHLCHHANHVISLN